MAAPTVSITDKRITYLVSGTNFNIQVTQTLTQFLVSIIPLVPANTPPLPPLVVTNLAALDELVGLWSQIRGQLGDAL